MQVLPISLQALLRQRLAAWCEGMRRWRLQHCERACRCAERKHRFVSYYCTGSWQ